jgi:hypothetical protein
MKKLTQNYLSLWLLAVIISFAVACGKDDSKPTDPYKDVKDQIAALEKDSILQARNDVLKAWGVATDNEEVKVLFGNIWETRPKPENFMDTVNNLVASIVVYLKYYELNADKMETLDVRCKKYIWFINELNRLYRLLPKHAMIVSLAPICNRCVRYKTKNC